METYREAIPQTVALAERLALRDHADAPFDEVFATVCGARRS